jgi:hypothetical protein
MTCGLDVSTVIPGRPPDVIWSFRPAICSDESEPTGNAIARPPGVLRALWIGPTSMPSRLAIASASVLGFVTAVGSATRLDAPVPNLAKSAAPGTKPRPTIVPLLVVRSIETMLPAVSDAST